MVVPTVIEDSTIVRTNNTGPVIGRAAYSPYGLIMHKEGDLDTPFLYNGKFGVLTDINGLLHMRARYYSPYLKRFLNADPIGFSGGSNWFAYVGGNPISKMDPFGLREYGIGLTGTGAAGGGATGGAGVYWSGNPNKYWYDNVGLYGTFGGVIGFEIGASGTFSVYEDGGMRGASTGIDAGVGPFGAALYKSTDPSATSTPFSDAADIIRDLGGSTPYLNRNIAGGAISGGLGAPVAASVTINRTGVLTIGDVGRGISNAFDNTWNYVFGAPASSVATPQIRTNLTHSNSRK